MTQRLAIDACAALHAKQTEALVVLEHFLERDVEMLMSRGVHGETVDMSLREWLGRHGVEPHRVPRQKTKAVRNKCNPRRLPGRKDLELVALARDKDAPVLTHDDAAAEATRLVGLVAVDLCDIIGFAAREGWVGAAELATLSRALDEHAWRAPDWKGDIQSTVAERPRYERSVAALRAGLALM